jgi:hypothetical protein
MTANGNRRRLEPEPERDWSSRPGAEALAAEIKRFWAAWGYDDIRVWTEPARGGRDALWVVKSTLRCGLPPPATAPAIGSPQQGR